MSTVFRALKIDVEGHEKSILTSFFNHAEKRLWLAAMVIEHVHDQDHIVEDLLHHYGYSVVGEIRRNLLLKIITS